MIAPRNAPARARADRRETTLLLAVAALVALAFLASMLYSTRGQFVPQVVDLYLVGQYARAMAEGHPFQYNAGEAASTGATSLLHTGILAAAHRVGIRGEGLIGFAILSGAALYLATVKMARDVGALLGGRREGWLAGGLVALGGPVVWGFLYGADIALFMFLTTWLLRSLLVAWPTGRFGPVVAPAVLAALTRPEGLPLAILVAVGWRLGPGRRARGAEGVLPWVAPAAGLLVLVNNRVFTGSWIGTSLADKSLFANFGIPTATGMVAEYGVDVIRGLLLGFYPSSATIGFNRGWAALCFPPLGLLLVAAAALRRHPLTTPVRLWLLAAAVLFALVSPNMFLGIHFNRYILWAFPTLLALVAVGAGELARARGRTARPRRLQRGGRALPAPGRTVDAALRRPLRRDGGRHPPARPRRRPLDRAIAARGRRHGQRRDEHRVPDRPPQPEPARRHEPRVPRHPGRRARRRDAGGARPPRRSAAVPDHHRGRARRAPPSCASWWTARRCSGPPASATRSRSTAPGTTR